MLTLPFTLRLHLNFKHGIVQQGSSRWVVIPDVGTLGRNMSDR